MPFRLLSGGGFRYVYLRNKKTEFEVGLAAIAEHERWEPILEEGESIIAERNLLKGAVYLGFYHDFKHMSVSFNQFYQGGYDGKSDLWRNRLSGNLQVDNKINKHLALTLSISVEHDTRPIIPIKKTYYAITNGIKIHL